MQKLTLIVYGSLILIVGLFIVPTVSAQNGLVTFELNQPGPLNPGDTYEVKVIVRNSQDELCTGCKVRLMLDEDNPQPGDEILPIYGKTDTNGVFNAKITSFTKDRLLFAQITSTDGLKFNSAPLLLKYRDIPMLGFVRLVTKVVSQVGSLPPLGNILAKSTTQRYIGEGEREVSFEWNKPFGTRRFDVWIFDKQTNSSNLIKSTDQTKTMVEVEAFKDLSFNIRACTVGDSCVDSYPLVLPRMDELAASSSSEINIPNFGLTDSYKDLEDINQNEEGLIFKALSPIKDWLSQVYSSFK